MEDKSQSPLTKLTDNIPDSVKVLSSKATSHKYFKPIAAILAVLLIWQVFSGTSVIPPDSVMQAMYAESENEEDETGKIEMIYFAVDFCEEVENERRKTVAECTITYQIEVTIASDFLGQKRNSKVKMDKYTDITRFWKDEKGKWVMDR